MCLPGAVVALWSLTQEMAGLNPFTLMIVTEFLRIQGKHFGKTQKSLCGGTRK